MESNLLEDSRIHQALEEFSETLSSVDEIETELPLCKVTSVKDLTLKDGVHFDTRSLRILGNRYFENYNGNSC